MLALEVGAPPNGSLGASLGWRLKNTMLPDTGLAVGPIDIMGLGASLSDEQIQQMAERIAPQTGSFGSMTSFTLADLLAQFDAETRTKLAAAIIAEGGDTQLVTVAMERVQSRSEFKRSVRGLRGPAGIVWGVLATASAAASAYHGYKRNDSIGWAIWWFFMGSLFPVITPVVAVAQGFGRREHG